MPAVVKPALDASLHVFVWIATQFAFLAVLSGSERRYVFAVAAGWLASLAIDVFRRVSLWTIFPVFLLWVGAFVALGLAGSEFWPAKATHGHELYRYSYITAFLAATPILLAAFLTHVRRPSGRADA